MTADGKIATANAKPRFSLLPLKILTGVVRVFAYGAKKYGIGNFLKAALADGAPERYYDALLRHFGEVQEPDSTFTKQTLSTLDEESGLPHIDHMICGLIMLRAILVKEGVLPIDPGMGKEPPAKQEMRLG